MCNMCEQKRRVFIDLSVTDSNSVSSVSSMLLYFKNLQVMIFHGIDHLVRLR